MNGPGVPVEIIESADPLLLEAIEWASRSARLSAEKGEPLLDLTSVASFQRVARETQKALQDRAEAAEEREQHLTSALAEVKEAAGRGDLARVLAIVNGEGE